MSNLINKIYHLLWSPVFSKAKSLITTSLKGNHYLECNVIIELFSLINPSLREIWVVLSGSNFLSWLKQWKFETWLNNNDLIFFSQHWCIYNSTGPALIKENLHSISSQEYFFVTISGSHFEVKKMKWCVWLVFHERSRKVKIILYKVNDE